MAVAAFTDPNPLGGPNPPRRRRSPVTFGRALVVVAAGLIVLLAYTFLGRQTITERQNRDKTVQVVLPPPPPPPPPKPAEVKPPEPIEKPMPVEQPQDTPPPPQPQAQAPTQGADALTAREGAGPSNYGLGVGNGGGTRIGGKSGPGGDGFQAYASVALTAIRIATQADSELARGRYSTELGVRVDADGRITDIAILKSSGDSRRDAKLRQILSGLLLSRRPPPGLPLMRIDLSSRPGA